MRRSTYDGPARQSIAPAVPQSRHRAIHIEHDSPIRSHANSLSSKFASRIKIHGAAFAPIVVPFRNEYQRPICELPAQLIRRAPAGAGDPASPAAATSRPALGYPPYGQPLWRVDRHHDSSFHAGDRGDHFGVERDFERWRARPSRCRG